ncbi:MAG: Spy/CpxP family protein refolding chaperone [Pyrinomonadaceae bacterium]
MSKLFTKTGLTVGLTAALSLTAFAQTTATQQQEGSERVGQVQEQEMKRHGRRGRLRRHKMRSGMQRRALVSLNLTDAQRQQLRDLRTSKGQSFQTRRQELRQLLGQRRDGGTLTPEQEQRARQLREELRAARQQMRADSLAVLTTEQRTQLEQTREEMKQRRQELRERRRSGTPPTTPR